MRPLIVVAMALSAVPISVAAKPKAAESTQQFVIGTDNLATVETALGKPNSVARTSDGTTEITYVAMGAHANGAAFVPIVGLFAGHAKGHSSYRKFTFDKAGTLSKEDDGSFATQCNMTGSCK